MPSGLGREAGKRTSSEETACSTTARAMWRTEQGPDHASGRPDYQGQRRKTRVLVPATIVNVVSFVNEPEIVPELLTSVTRAPSRE